MAVALLVFVGVAMQAAASGHLSLMYIGRFITGIAVGIASTVSPLYVSENAPRGIRGLLTGFYQLSIVTGLTLAFWINYGCLLHVKGHAQFINTSFLCRLFLLSIYIFGHGYLPIESASIS
uniref:Major facilitator superfamily (MFS) profile domain-containing protein n=1 Tax=Fusarium oxysporum (strain Fo5176) TaxID=660025 RepID=A0A0D2YHJ3_FUSOF